MSDIYESPLVTRYASKEMASLFSMQKRIETWRRLWLELARAEHALGLPITDGQINDLQAHLTDIDFACAEQREKEVRHDVMAHIYAYGKAAPSAAGILHLGATSCYVDRFRHYSDNLPQISYQGGCEDAFSLRSYRHHLFSCHAHGDDGAADYPFISDSIP